ncbi:uncharacterized protein LOC116162568 [Photinus pyralis]|nr:uncharacterized protein LOC116162568 [Photinus pyralis]
MTPRKCEEIGDKKFKKRRRSSESRTNSSDTENVIGDHACKRKVGKGKRVLDAESSENSLINATKFAVEKKSLSKQVQVDTFRFRDAIRPSAKSPSGAKKPPTKPKTSQLKKVRSKKLAEEPDDKPEPQSAPVPQKPWLRYSSVAQNALSLLNNEVSSALCQVLGSIDDIQMRVRATMDEIQQCDKVYERLRHQKVCHSSPILAAEPLHNAANESLPHALEVGLLQTQSENQMRIAVDTPVTANEQSEDELSKPVDSNSDEEVTIVEAKKVELEVKDSLPQPEKRAVGKKGKKKSKVIQILAEELYVPEKINKIMESSLPPENPTGKRFMYQETTKKPKKKRKYPNSLLFPEAESTVARADSNQCNIIIETAAPDPHEPSGYPLSKSGLNCFDILDEITLNDVRPLRSEYPRRDCEGRKVESTYLYRLVRGSMQAQFLELLRLEEPSLTCSQKCDSCSSVKTQPKKSPVKKSKKSDHDEVAAKLRQYLFDPHIRYPTTITVMPVVITTYTNPNFVKAPGGDCATKKTPRQTKTKDKPAKKPNRPTPRRDESWGDFETAPKRLRSPKPNRKWEKNIQSLIELVEHKIVEILSDPKSTHLDAFKSVETKIIELLHGQKSLDAIEEQKPPRPKFLSKTTSNLDKPKCNALESNTYPSLVDNVRSLPLQIMRLNLKAPTCKRIDESTATTKSITAANTRSEQTSCTFPDIYPSLEVINFLDTLANISTVALGDVTSGTRTTVFYKWPIRISYPFSTCTLFHAVRVTGAPRDNSPSRPQRNRSSLPVRNCKKKCPTKAVTFKSAEDEDRNPKTDEDGAEWEEGEGFDYNRLLNYLYGALFTIEFLGLTFNYSCNS